MGHLSDENVLTELSEFYKSFDGVKGYIGYSELGKPVFFFENRRVAARFYIGISVKVERF